MAYITIVKGDDTDFLDNQYLVVKFNTEIELAGFQAIFKLGNIELLYPDLSAKYIEIVLSKDVTSILPKGKMYGSLQLVDTQNRVRTITTVLPFNIITKVLNASQISQQSIQLDVKVEKNEISVGLNILGLSKVVAENYLNQMKQNNLQMTEKLHSVKLTESKIENLSDSLDKKILSTEKNLQDIISDANSTMDSKLTESESIMNEFKALVDETTGMFDGCWEKVTKTLLTSTAMGTYTIDLSGVLPDDGNVYEILFKGAFYSNNSTQSGLWVATSLVSEFQVCVAGATNTNPCNVFVLPVGADRVMTARIAGSDSKGTVVSVSARRKAR